MNKRNNSPGKCVNRKTNKIINMTSNKSGNNKSGKKGGSGAHIIKVILILIVVIFLVFIVVRTVQFLTETCYAKKSWAEFVFSGSSDPCISKYAPASFKERKLENEKEVYHIANQRYTFDQAKCKCESYGGRLANRAEIINSYNNGANWCTYGWSAGQDAYYPVQKCYHDKLQNGPKRLRNSCGSPGLNGGHFANPNLKFGVNCFGVKPPGKVATPKQPECEQPGFCERPDNKDASRRLDTDRIVPFSNDQWSQYLQ